MQDTIAPTDQLSDRLIASSGSTWEAYVEHPFITQLQAGTLPLASFLHFIRQGYLYLLHYARAHAIAGYKAQNLESLAASNVIIQSCIKEVEKNVLFCERHGISKQELEDTPESIVTVAYSRWLLDIAFTKPALDLQVALLPCLIGYAVIGTRLLAKSDKEVERSDKNQYYSWIAEYAAEEYQGYAAEGRRQLEISFQAGKHSQERLGELETIFSRAVEFEIAFWNSALQAGLS